MIKNSFSSRFTLTKKLLITAVITLSLISCYNSPAALTASGSWTFNGTKYNADAVKRNDYVLIATNGSGSSANQDMVNFVFKTYPTASGTYKMVSFNANGGQPANANEVTVGAMNSSKGGPYYSSSFANVSATVTVTNGKVHIVVPEVWAATIDNSDSVKISADIKEP